MNRICRTKEGKFLEMQSDGKVERLSWMEWSLSINDPKERTEENYNQYLAECDALEVARLNTLKQNALRQGYKEEDIEVKWVTDEEWAIIEVDLNKPTPEQIAAQEKEALIQAKMREMAEAELIAEGVLTVEEK
jgi:hypothetical protein